MNLFVERYLELLLKRKGTPLTSDKIRHSLSRFHVMSFKELGSNKEVAIESQLDKEVEKIFKTLNLSIQRIFRAKTTFCT